MDYLNGKKTVFCLLLSLLFPGTVVAQETTGAIRGEVTDPSGAVIPGATIEVNSPALIRAQSASTDAAGAYAFLTLPPGSYQVNVTAQGFAPVKRVNIDLQVGKQLRIDFKLEVGGTTQTVEVISEAAIVDVSQSTVAANVSQSTFDRLPKGRSFDSLIALAPGARFEDKSGGYQVDGASASENVFVIDGMDMTNLYSGALNMQSKLPTEFVQELQIKSSGFEAQYGGAMGGVVNVVTKSGSNDFHGDIALYLSSDAVRSRPRPTLELDPTVGDGTETFRFLQNSEDGYRLLNPGASVGGPVKRDKVWFFAGWYPELVKINRTVTFLSNNATRSFERTQRTDFMNAKVDVAPTAKLRAYAGYIYSPYKVNGYLPNRNGTDSPDTPWADEGDRFPSSSYTFGADYTATPKLILSARGGYNYTNHKSYGVPGGPYIRYVSGNTALPSVGDIPAEWRRGLGIVTTNNAQTTKDVQNRFRTNADVSYITNLAGQHTFKAGWEINRLYNSPEKDVWPDGYLRFGWGRAYTGITVPGSVKGKYGYVMYRYYGIAGDVSSTNQAFFFQDNWQVAKRLTLIAGLRTEREFVPSFVVGDNVPSKAIEFGFGEKLAPRLGFAYDVLGNAKWKVSGAFGLFYDLMKYALPQGSFGGAQWKDYVYPLDNPDPAYYISKIPRGAKLAANAPLKDLTGLFEIVDWRIPSNDPNDNTIDPGLKPMRRRVYDLSSDYAITPTVVLSARYTHNQMDRAIEDVGTLTPAGEKYYIANPGMGLVADPSIWEPGVPPTPRAVRDYDAVELRADKRFSNNYYFSASYTWSRLYGNYSGLSSSDELTNNTGRQDPNVSRYFDLPFMSFDSRGRQALGRLATDRPHAFKFYGAYTWKNKLGETNFGPSFFLMSGTPITTEAQVVSTVPIYVNGRSDLGRTPVYSQTDMYVYHEFKLPGAERYRFRIDANVTNLFNQNTVTSHYAQYNHAIDGQIDIEHAAFFKGFDYKALLAEQGLRVDPRYNRPNAWQNIRDMRFGLKFSF